MATASVLRQVVVDDSDPRFIYTGTWTVNATSLNDLGNYGPIYNQTSHGTSQIGSVSFTFTGTSIALYGTNQTLLSFSCTVDNVQTVRSPVPSTPENNWILCQAASLTQDSHTIVLSVASEPSSGTVWIDYAMYTPLETATIDDNSVIYVPSTDSGVEYSAGWSVFQAYTSTSDSYHSQSPNASVQFQFIGTQVSWSGWFLHTFPHNPSTATYSIDNSSSLSSTFEMGNTPATNVSIINNIFFTTPVLSYGLHTLVVTYDGGPANASIGGPTPINLGYLLVTGTSFRLSDTSPSASVTEEGGQAIHASNAGAIAGGVVGGLLIVTIGLLLFLIFRRRQQKQTAPKGPKDQQPIIEPFLAHDFTASHTEGYATSAAKGYAYPPMLLPSQNGSASVAGSSTTRGIIDTYTVGGIGVAPMMNKERAFMGLSGGGVINANRSENPRGIGVQLAPPSYSLH
ncbi:hypothetical protein H0H92_015534 [Tricholoma furcatifolium]|nr:hypothetical protein H0H92_015534 [Tricholoma furcatifolium]